MQIEIVPVLSDNYVYLIRDESSGAVGIVDPGEAGPVEAALARLGWTPTHILNTHHHGDHTAGNAALKGRFGCTLVGPRAETTRIPDMDVTLGDEEVWRFGDQDVRFLHVPGHTRGHGAFWFEESGHLFSGDALFAMGCGRLFEGTPAEMWASLLKMRDLPADTQVWCGHEYTLSNARFAADLLPGDPAVAARLHETSAQRDQGRPTLPTTIGRERLSNPFLRADEASVQEAVGMRGSDPVAVFAEIRRRKDTFR
ncbi:hydroxyacylglutathione hydrolase [Arenibaculum pallidiluteum]|uniref:hydroxyacylglutathione hydrolase n=1 Tax=Arenibaculum pallidiluteum TaxID=2812559 RepID=UPI001A9797DD|nr:hydroxyacylglutathione hydrolase [Arenibaculum pallidiluteum]